MTTPIDRRLLRKIQNGALRRLPARRRQATNLFVLDDVQKPGALLRARHQEIPVDRDTAVIFADDEPLANWSHDCRYLLHDARTGEMYREVQAGFPPFLLDPPDTFRAFHLPVVAQNPLRRVWTLERERFVFRLPKGRRYAILYSGASNNRHVNDMEFLYRELVDQFYFREEDITVLNYDGTLNYAGGPKPVGNYPGDGTPYRMPVDGPGTRAALSDALDALKPKLKADDTLLIHTNNHGGHDGTESYLCTYSGADYGAADFGTKLSELPAFADLVVMMEQCHSGGFNDRVIENSTAARTTFAGACTERKNSIGGAEFDPFARDWISALAGADPYGGALASDPDHDASGRISAREAFAYADDVHHWYDSPVYSAFGVDAGDQTLHQKWRYLFLHRELVMREIEELRLRIDDPRKFREIMREKVLPALGDLDDRLVARPERPEAIEKIIREAVAGLPG
ncbi:caspase family protein [Rhodovulum marinum]|uniref:Caspase domain-containing protein n=1 Tax=Rhodovulum marinum TaxID=320662 RepID=A0A4R2Q8Z1_9RHOB|nr:caspase family protein [Rhodovulum marinum]TCP43251.1 caspase domain-containing protein [Rhodovulum marinum]